MTVEQPRRHVVSALVVDRPGTLNRVSGLFRARSFNIESLTVGTTLEPGRSRMTVVVRGDEAHLHQVLAQLERLIEVIEVEDLTHTGRVEQELVLLELVAPSSAGATATVTDAIAHASGTVISTEGDVWRVRLTASPAQVEEALDRLRPHGLRDLVRAGSVAMSTGRPATQPTATQIGASTP